MSPTEFADSLIAGDSAALRDDRPVMIAIPEHIDCLNVKGTDAFTFLQGQVTCDMTEVEQGALRLGSHCTPKGRAQASFIAARDSDGACLFLPKGLLEPTLQQLKKYAAFSKVSLSTSGERHLVAVAGAQAPGWLQSLTAVVDNGSPDTDAPVVHALPGNPGVFLLSATTDALNTLLASAPAGSLRSGERGFWQLLTLAGQAHVFPQTQEHFIPQELNHDLCGGISFRKGCYKGQEIIARLHFRGTPKYRTRLYAGKGPTPLPGSPCLDVSAQSLGEVAQAVETAPGHCLVLAVVRQDSSDDQALQVRTDAAADETCDLTPIPGGCAIPPSSA
jgi:folate-binding protein YgfZ